MSAEPASIIPPAPSANVSRIAETLLSQVPQVQEHAVTEHAAQQAADALKDSTGALFNEAIHARDSAGQPMRTAAGAWAKKRGRKAGSGPASSVAPAPLVGTSGTVASPVEQARIAGANAAAALVTIGMVIGGDEWKPIQQDGIDEFANLQKVFGDYFVAKNMKDLPPGVALAIGLAGYAGPRCFMPVTKSRLGTAKAWVSEKVTKMYLWYVGRRGK